MRRILFALLFAGAALGEVPIHADEITAIKQADGTVSKVKSNGGNTQVINSTGRPNAHVSDRPHDEAVRMFTRDGSKVVKQGR